MPPPVLDAVSTISVAQNALSIVTVTPTAGTTTVFITSSFSPTSTSSSSKGGSSASRQKAVIAGSAVGGFAGFSLILGLLLWFFYFRKSNRQDHDGLDGARGVIFGGRRTRRDDEKHGASSSISHAPAPTSELANDGSEKLPDSADVSPVQPNSATLAADRPLIDESRPRPIPKRTITSVSDSDGRRRIPVVVPSFTYRDSQGSGSSGAASRFANALKRGSGAGATVSSTSSGTPYQYGMVGSAESRRGSTLATEVPAVPLDPTDLPAHFYDEHGRIAPGHSPGKSKNFSVWLYACA